MKSFKKVIAVCIMLAVLATLVLPANADAAAKVKISKTKLTIETLQSHTLKVTGITRKTNVTWSSSNKEVAVVAEGGMVTGIKVGKTTITAKVGKKKYTCAVTVKQGRSADDEIVVVYGWDGLEYKELREYVTNMKFKEVLQGEEYSTIYHMTRGQQKEILEKVRELSKTYIDAKIPNDIISVRPNEDFTIIDVSVCAGASMEYDAFLSNVSLWACIYQGYSGINGKEVKVTVDFYYGNEKFETIVY